MLFFSRPGVGCSWSSRLELLHWKEKAPCVSQGTLLGERLTLLRKLGICYMRNVPHQPQGWVRPMGRPKEERMEGHYVNIGIDLGIKARNRAQIRSEDGEKLGDNYSFYTTKESLDRLCTQAKEHAPESTIRLVVEATGMAWFPIAIYQGKGTGYFFGYTNS